MFFRLKPGLVKIGSVTLVTIRSRFWKPGEDKQKLPIQVEARKICRKMDRSKEPTAEPKKKNKFTNMFL